MYTRLVYAADYTTTFVYGWNDDKNAYHDLAYKAHHAPFPGSSKVDEFPKNCENDFYITFKSDVKFDQWLAKVKKSEFAEPLLHRLFSHNCAHGAKHTLKLAGIDVLPNKDYFILNRISSYPVDIRFPLRTLSPADLYQSSKNYELNQLKNSKGEIRYRFTEFRIKLWADSTSLTEEKTLVTKIVNGIEKSHQKYPERTEEYIRHFNANLSPRYTISKYKKRMRRLFSTSWII